MKEALFVYGSLQIPHLLERLLGHKVQMTPARIEGYTRHISHDGYPLAVKGKGNLEGRIIKVTRLELQRIDAWEEVPTYERVQVEALIDKDKEVVQIYEGKSENIDLGRQERSFDQMKKDLEEFLETQRHHSFEPVVAKEPRLLILGSMPGKDSLREVQYYAHPRNAFWKIIFEIFNEPLSYDYEVRKSLIRNHHLALWDVLSECLRDGSLDSAITHEKVNDFEIFLDEHSSIKTILFNGAKAYDTYKRHFSLLPSLEYIKMPSTSPAYTLAYDKKKQHWQRVILENLGKRD